jgi:hypothetical protein
MADGDCVEQGRDRAAGHCAVQPVQRLLVAGHLEGADTADKRPNDQPKGHQIPSGPATGAAPNATAASAMNSNDQSGQKARVARSATMPPASGAGARSGGEAPLACGSLGRSCALSGGLPDTCFRAAWDHTHSGTVSRFMISSNVGRADDGELIAFHQNLGDQRAGVVLARHHRAIGPGRAEGDQIARATGGICAAWQRYRRSRRPGRRCRRALFGARRGLDTGTISCHAPYIAGRIRSFIAASRIRKSRPSPSFT